MLILMIPKGTQAKINYHRTHQFTCNGKVMEENEAENNLRDHRSSCTD